MIETLFYVWVFMGVITWLMFPRNEFDLSDFVFGLSLCILLWPRALRKMFVGRGGR